MPLARKLWTNSRAFLIPQLAVTDNNNRKAVMDDHVTLAVLRRLLFTPPPPPILMLNLDMAQFRKAIISGLMKGVVEGHVCVCFTVMDVPHGDPFSDAFGARRGV